MLQVQTVVVLLLLKKEQCIGKRQIWQEKAGRVDPSLSGSSSQAANSYSAKAPSKEMIFSSGMAGKTVTFNCWVGGSVKVPSL